jgi:hypothetical protein
MSSPIPAVIVLGPPGAGTSTLALGLCAGFPQLGHLAPRRFLVRVSSVPLETQSMSNWWGHRSIWHGEGRSDHHRT